MGGRRVSKGRSFLLEIMRSKKGGNFMDEGQWERRWPPEMPYDYTAMNLEKALVLIEGAKEKSSQIGFTMTMAVCDAAGNPVAMQKMDDAPHLSLEIANNKARTAVYGKIPTAMWSGFFKGADPEIAPLWFHSDWITFPGGFPVLEDSKVIGGFGVSGATWEDIIIARSGLAALGADLSGAEASLTAYDVPEDKW